MGQAEKHINIHKRWITYIERDPINTETIEKWEKNMNWSFEHAKKDNGKYYMLNSLIKINTN